MRVGAVTDSLPATNILLTLNCCPVPTAQVSGILKILTAGTFHFGEGMAEYEEAISIHDVLGERGSVAQHGADIGLRRKPTMVTNGVKRLSLFLIAGLAACAAPLPKPGDTVYLEVRETVKPDRLAQGWTRNIRNALAHGLTREDLENGRLVTAYCARQTPSGVVDDIWLARVPPGIRFTGSIHHREFAELRPGVRKDQSGPLGEVLSKTAAPADKEMLKLPYPGKRIACDATSRPGTVRAEIINVSDRRWLDEIDFEESWTRALPKEALEQGRIITAICARGTDSFEYWYVQLEPGQAVERGQVIMAQAGNSIAAGPGPLSRVVDRGVSRYQSDKVFGAQLVRCSQ